MLQYHVYEEIGDHHDGGLSGVPSENIKHTNDGNLWLVFGDIWINCHPPYPGCEQRIFRIRYVEKNRSEGYPNVITFSANAQKEFLAALGLPPLKKIVVRFDRDGEFRVQGINDDEESSYYTDDRQDAIDTALLIHGKYIRLDWHKVEFADPDFC
jgi:hypothetical protein